MKSVTGIGNFAGCDITIGDKVLFVNKERGSWYSDFKVEKIESVAFDGGEHVMIYGAAGWYEIEDFCKKFAPFI